MCLMVLNQDIVYSNDIREVTAVINVPFKYKLWVFSAHELD